MNDQSQYMPGAEPFFFPGNETGCLLIHGFTGTPYEMRALGQWLHETWGFTVFGPALAGHGTRVEDMARTRWQDWYASVRDAHALLAARCPRILALGLSLGGVLALCLAADRPVTAVIAASTPYELHVPVEPLFRLFPFLFTLVPFVKKDKTGGDTQDRSIQAAHPEYDCNPTHCAASLLWDLLPHFQSEMSQVRVPALLLQARGDRTIPLDSMPRIFDRLASPVKQQVWIERGGHLVFEDYGRDQARQAIAGFVERHLGLVASAPVPRGQAVATDLSRP